MGEAVRQLQEGREAYFYAVVPWSEEKGRGPLAVRGLFGAEVRLVPAGKFAAVVSEVPDGTEKIRPERAHLAGHQRVVTELASWRGGLLPVAFGTVVPSLDDLIELLSGREEELLAQLERVRDAVEFEVRLDLKVASPFEYFVGAYEELREARDRLFGKPGGPTQEEKIGLGQLFERILQGDRQEVTAKLEAGLSGAVLGLRTKEPRNEKELARLSLLVGRDRQGEMDRAIEAVAGTLGDEYGIFVTGPFPCYSFVDVHLTSPP
jgi:hypothetical protein